VSRLPFKNIRAIKAKQAHRKSRSEFWDSVMKTCPHPEFVKIGRETTGGICIRCGLNPEQIKQFKKTGKF